MEGSSIVEFRGFGIINGSILQILAVLSDTDRHPEWVANCIETRILEQKSDKDYIYYSSSAAPWPVTDREFISRARVLVNDKAKSITIAGRELQDHAKAPSDTGRVRMPFIRVTWYMKSLKKYKGKKTWLSFRVHADPGGLIPSWVVNLVSKKIPYESIRNLRRQIKIGDISDEFLEKYSQYKDWY